MVVISLISRGSPAQMTGGHLYHQRMAEPAPAHGAVVERITAGGLRDPVRRARGVVLVDSLTAWSVAPWSAAAQPSPTADRRHRPPAAWWRGPGRIRTALQRPLDLALYRRCDLLVVTGHGVRPRAGGPLAPPRRADPRGGAGVRHPGRRGGPGDELDLRRGRRIALLNVANWWPNKGVLELLDAVAALPRDRVTLHLVGREDVDPGYGRRVHARLRAPDLAGRVVVHGPLAPAQVGAALRRRRRVRVGQRRRDVRHGLRRGAGGRAPDRRLAEPGACPS